MKRMSSSGSISRRDLLKGAAIGGGALLLGKPGIATAADGTITSTRPYVLPAVSGVKIKPILTTGDEVDGYRMCGIPDGLGALAKSGDDDDRSGTFELYVNHEITSGAPGLQRAHGSNGAFVSKWTIDRSSLHVLKGEDLTPSGDDVHQWNGSAYFTGTTQWQRLCSADLPDEKALRHGNRGTSERIFFNGEEINFGRAWARIVTGPHAGEAWELPRLGRMSFENVVLCPHGKDKTIVGLFDDGNIDPTVPAASNPCEVFIYVGDKQTSGNEIERVGLTNGKFYGVRVYRGNTQLIAESNDFGLGDVTTGYVGKGRFDLVELGPNGDVSAMTGVQIEQAALDAKVFHLQRPEDGAWDPRENKRTLYFVSTGEIAPNTTVDKNSRLWRMTFDDLDNPQKGGTIEILLSGKELGGPGWRMFDNITIDHHGRLLLQEDTGNNPWVARIWLYSIEDGSVTKIAEHDHALFQPTSAIGVTPVTGGPDFLTQDEESSGIIDAEEVLGRGWFLFDVQNHKKVPVGSDPFGLVEGGQLLAMYVDPKIGAGKDHD
jgi:hypothetical protein